MVLVGTEARLVNADHHIITCQRGTELLSYELPLGIELDVIVLDFCRCIVRLYVAQASVQDRADGGWGWYLVHIVAGQLATDTLQGHIM